MSSALPIRCLSQRSAALCGWALSAAVCLTPSLWAQHGQHAPHLSPPPQRAPQMQQHSAYRSIPVDRTSSGQGPSPLQSHAQFDVQASQPGPAALSQEVSPVQQAETFPQARPGQSQQRPPNPQSQPYAQPGQRSGQPAPPQDQPYGQTYGGQPNNQNARQPYSPGQPYSQNQPYSQAPPYNQNGGRPEFGGQQGNPRPNPQSVMGGQHLAQWMDSHRNLPLSEQQGALSREPGFSQLPSQQQQRMRDRLTQLNNMAPADRERTINRTEQMERLSPPQRQQVRGATQQFSSLPPDRRRAVARGFRNLRDLPPDQRQAYLNSPQARQQYSDQERSTLNNLLTVSPLLPR